MNKNTLKLDEDTLKLWHGSQRWEGTPRILPPKKGRHEYGPGLYLTNSRERATLYSKGGGSLMLFEIEPDIVFIENVFLTRNQMNEALNILPKLKNREQINEDLDKASKRRTDGRLPASSLVNLFINHDALTPQDGVTLAQWLTARGIDASCVNHSGKEEWIVIFNPEKIRKTHKIAASQADSLGVWEWPEMEKQKENYRKNNSRDEDLCVPKRTLRL